MRLRLVLVNLFIIKVSGNVENDLILDYFMFKGTKNVVGLTCDQIEGDIALIKNFSQVGIAATLGHVSDESLLNRLFNTKYYKLGVYVDIRCNDSLSISNIFFQANAKRLYDELHSWLVLSFDLEGATDAIVDDNFGLSTDFAVAVPGFASVDGEDCSFELYDVYNPFKRRGGKLNVTFLGVWKRTQGLEVHLTQSKYDRRSNLHGMTWKVSFFGSKYRPRNVSLEDHFQDMEKTGTKDGLSKFGFNIVKHLAEMYNVHMELGEYSKWRKNDRMGPLTKALQFDEIDICGTPISVFQDKLRVLKFVYTCWPFRTCFMFRSPQLRDIKIHEVLRPLATKVWYLSSVMTVLIMVVIAINFSFEQFDTYFILRYSNSFLVTIGCLCQQGTNFKMKNVSTRIVFLNMMIFSLLIYNYYSASVVSARLNEPIVKINDSLDSLAMTDLQVASEPMLYFDFFMKENAKQAELFNRKKWQKVDDLDKFILPEIGMQLVKRGGFAYHTHPEVGYRFVNGLFDNREICELTEVHLAKPSFRSIAVPYNSSFSEISKRGFTKMTEVGIRQRQLRRWTSWKPLCRRDILSASSMTIYEFAPHLILLFIGMALAALLCVIEILVTNHQINQRINFRVKKKKKEIVKSKKVVDAAIP